MGAQTSENAMVFHSAVRNKMCIRDSIQPAEVGKPWQEAEHIDAVIDRGMDTHDFLRGQPRDFFHAGKVRAERAAIATVHLEDAPPRGGCGHHIDV